LVDGVEALLANESIFLEPYVRRVAPFSRNSFAVLVALHPGYLESESLLTISQLHQLLPPLLSIVLTVPLGPHPPDPSSRLTPFDLRLRATDVLGKIASQYGSQYAGLVPRLVSTLNSALHSQPFPSPLGASTPPSGRYEGAVLGLAALGPQAVRSSIWGKSGDGLRWVDDLVGRMYPDAKPGRTGLMRAALVRVASIALTIAPLSRGGGGASLILRRKRCSDSPAQSQPKMDRSSRCHGTRSPRRSVQTLQRRWRRGRGWRTSC
jgi:hypothetical protein